MHCSHPAFTFPAWFWLLTLKKNVKVNVCFSIYANELYLPSLCCICILSLDLNKIWISRYSRGEDFGRPNLNKNYSSSCAECQKICTRNRERMEKVDHFSKINKINVHVHADKIGRNTSRRTNCVQSAVWWRCTFMYWWLKMLPKLPISQGRSSES